MKRHTLIAILSLLIIAACLFSACSTTARPPSASDNSANTSTTTDYVSQIRALENKILELQQNQNLSDTEYQKELAKLTAELEALKKQSESQGTTSSDKDQTTATPNDTPHFLYTVNNNKATLTGYTGNVTHLVIPSAIDGYAVYDIADNAFSSNTLKSVTISNGICRIDWFAFAACSNLESITIPSSVTSIGYSALPTSSKKLTIYCHSGSFAQSYAQSYGLNYTVI